MGEIISFSGGKDSTAMLLRMLELNYKIDSIVFADTGFEFPEIYDHIKNTERVIGRKITIIRTSEDWHKWFYGKITRGKRKGQQRGMPLKFFPCWWSREAKFKILEKYCKGHNRYIGIAADEPRRIKEKPGYIYPLNEWGWTEDKCLSYIQKKGLYCKIHLRFKRSGCWWCPKQSKESIETLKEFYPGLYAEMLKIQKEAPNMLKEVKK